MKRFFLLFLLMFGLTSQVFAADLNLKSETGLVTAIQYEDMENLVSNTKAQTKQIATVKILSGEFKNRSVDIENVLTGNPYYDIFLKNGDRVILHGELNGDEVEYFIADIQRINFVYILTGLFCTLLLIVGAKKGFFSLVSILMTIALIFFVLSPMILSGFNPIFAAVIVCILSSAITIYLVGGLNYKSTSAVAGTVLTLIFAAILSSATIYFSRLTGFSSEECMFLYSAHPNLDFIGILSASMMLATLGALMDTAMSIASSVNEFYNINEKLNFKELFKSGMNVGKDIIGTMANTLILVYLGTSLPLVLLSQNIDLQKFFNLNQVVTEVTSALIGSIAIVICVPVTAILTAYLMRFNKNEISDIMIEEDNQED